MIILPDYSTLTFSQSKTGIVNLTGHPVNYSKGLRALRVKNAPL